MLNDLLSYGFHLEAGATIRWWLTSFFLIYIYTFTVYHEDYASDLARQYTSTDGDVYNISLLTNEHMYIRLFRSDLVDCKVEVMWMFSIDFSFLLPKMTFIRMRISVYRSIKYVLEQVVQVVVILLNLNVETQEILFRVET